MASLSSATVGFCPKTIRRYTYPRAALRHGIAHLGLGAFARGHLADFTDDALEAEFGQWGITGISLVSPAMAQKLLPQDGLYTLKTTGAGNEALRVRIADRPSRRAECVPRP